MARNPYVAGQFYPGSKAALEKEMKSLTIAGKEKEDAIGMISPHAGYIYSGGVAGALFSAVKPKDIYIILGPNHTGLGGPFGVSTERAWTTPMGDVEVNSALADEIKKNCVYVKSDDLSHSREHSIEVQLPFLQYQGNDFTFVPISISYGDLNIYRAIGSAIASSVKKLGIEKRTAMIASSDMTHYESQESASRKDNAAIEAILKLDEEMLVNRVSTMGISMCGYAPAAIAIAACKRLGAKRARLVKYATSGDTSGDYSSVVGYAGIAIS